MLNNKKLILNVGKVILPDDKASYKATEIKKAQY